MQVIARDQGIPQLSSAVKEVTIFVLRNQHPPIFIDAPYSVSMAETSQQNAFIYAASASDADSEVRTQHSTDRAE